MASHRSKNKLADDHDRFGAAMARVGGEIEAFPASRLVPLNLDASRAISIVLNALAAILQLRTEIVGLPGFEKKNVDHLGDYALAAVDVRSTRKGLAPTASDLNEEALALRALLFQDAQTLAMRKLIDPTLIADGKHGTGYGGVA